MTVGCGPRAGRGVSEPGGVWKPRKGGVDTAAHMGDGLLGHIGLGAGWAVAGK